MQSKVMDVNLKFHFFSTQPQKIREKSTNKWKRIQTKLCTSKVETHSQKNITKKQTSEIKRKQDNKTNKQRNNPLPNLT